VPTKAEHLNKATGIAALADSLKPLTDQAKIDWALVMLFYAAVHYVEAYLSTLTPAIHLRSHTTRDSYMGRNSTLKKVYKEYQDLKFYGYNARYELFGFTSRDVTDVAAKNFAKIKNYLDKIL
jgi:hypothetical protein